MINEVCQIALLSPQTIPFQSTLQHCSSIWTETIEKCGVWQTTCIKRQWSCEVKQQAMMLDMYIIHSFCTSATLDCCIIMSVWLYCILVKIQSVQLQFEPQFRITSVFSQLRTNLATAQNVLFVWKMWPIKFPFGCDTIFSEECVASILSVTKRHQAKCWRIALAPPFETSVPASNCCTRLM